MMDDQFPETTRNVETTTYGATVYEPPVEHLCKNCRFWKVPHNPNSEMMEIGFRLCEHDKLKDGWNEEEYAPDELVMFTDSTSPYTGPDFGCVHFEPKEEQ